MASVTAGCAHPDDAGLPGPGATPSGNPTGSPTPVASCAPQATGQAVFVAMSVLAVATTDPTYGLINGYAPIDDTGFYNDIATVIMANPTDVLQFENADDLTPVTIVHSAVGLPQPFPTPGYVFPSPAASPEGSAITNSSLWSTGRVQPICFSQPFTLTTGTYYFGDIDYYGSINMRDVLVVSPSVAPASLKTLMQAVRVRNRPPPLP
jgi:hypothetical protein